jgi:hypothetical protein
VGEKPAIHLTAGVPKGFPKCSREIGEGTQWEGNGHALGTSETESFTRKTYSVAIPSSGYYSGSGTMASKLDKHLDEIVEERKRGISFSVIAASLDERHGLEITKRGLAGWYRRRQRQLRDRKEEVEVFAPECLASPFPAEIPQSPRQSDDDDWTAPVAPRKLVLKVMKNSQKL